MHVLATAGHVDHGKSTLVRALTGMEPDRYAEEQRRGMTIDLGFVWTVLPSGQALAFVDVPGHARFVPTMLAGVGPVPAVLFVVAADEGWQPQSAEHLAVLHAFGVRHGVLAVTRSDLADPAPAARDALARLGRTSLAGLPAVAVSGATGQGLDGLRGALDALAARLPAPDPGAPVRLWVDRAFSMPGSGTVVTGTLAAGTLRVGDELELAPGGRAVTVRGLESRKCRTPAATPVARVAVNLRNVARGEVPRGSVLLTPGAWPSPTVVDARLSGPAAGLPEALMLHVGSAAVPARLRVLAGGPHRAQPAGPRARAGGVRVEGPPDLVRLTLAAPLPLRPGDRVVLRDPSRNDRLAGATLLDVAPPPLRRRGAAAARGRELRHVPDRPDLVSEVARRGAVRRADVLAFGVPAKALPPPARPAGGAAGHPPRGIVAIGEWLVDAGRWQAWARSAAAAVGEHAREHPLDPAPALPVVAARIGLPDAALLGPLLAAAGLATAAGRVQPPGAADPLPPPARRAVDALRARLLGAAFDAPDVPELRAAGLTDQVLAAAVRTGELAAVGDGIWLLPGWMDEAARRLAGLPQPFTVSAARQALGTTRRVALPVLAALDAARRTRRIDASTRVVVGVP